MGAERDGGVVGEHARLDTEGGVVDRGEGVIEVVDSADGGDRCEDLVAVDAGTGWDVGEHGGCDAGAVAVTAGAVSVESRLGAMGPPHPLRAVTPRTRPAHPAQQVRQHPGPRDNANEVRQHGWGATAGRANVARRHGQEEGRPGRRSTQASRPCLPQ